MPILVSFDQIVENLRNIPGPLLPIALAAVIAAGLAVLVGTRSRRLRGTAAKPASADAAPARGDALGTAELEHDTPLIVEHDVARRFRARTERTEPEGIAILVEDGELAPEVGTAIQVYLKSEGGIHTFSSQVLARDGSRARIAHAQTIRPYQKRAYYRRKLNLSVSVRAPGDSPGLLPHRFRDLGGGGASITNSDLRFRPGDDLEISFTPGEGEPIVLTGEVVRLSEAGQVMHIAFAPMREAMRNRILSFILKLGRDG
jgi:hypothetical protein